MIRSTVLTGVTLSLLPLCSWAASPNVVADIAPLHSIVSEVMNGVGEPVLLVQPEASPHSYSLRPSEAKALAEADVVFWIGEELTPWLANSLNNLAGSAQKIEMLELSATVKHGYREGATFEAHAHAHAKGAHDDEHHDEHDKHHHDHDKHHDGHDKHHDGHDEHHHGDYDPHAWLDPVNAKRWANEIAQVLSATDSSNAETYKQNAEAFAESIDELTASLNERAARLEGIRFIVFHDAYQYFERRFDIPAAGAISIGDASDPSPARIRKIQARVSELGVTCAFTEPQYNPGLVDTVFEGSKVKTVAVMDPLGVDLEVGSGQYPQLIKKLMSSLEQCR